MFWDLTLQWKHIYTLPHITTIDSKLQCFQYRVLHSTLYLTQKLFLFRKHNTSLCSFWSLQLFVNCSKTKRLWCTVTEYFKINLHIPLLSAQSAIFGFLEADDRVFLILNHLSLLFKDYAYVSRNSKVLSFEALLKFIIKVCKLAKILSQSDERKTIYRKMENNSANSIKLLENLRWHLFKFSYTIDTMAVVRT